MAKADVEAQVILSNQGPTVIEVGNVGIRSVWPGRRDVAPRTAGRGIARAGHRRGAGPRNLWGHNQGVTDSSIAKVRPHGAVVV